MASASVRTGKCCSFLRPTFKKPVVELLRSYKVIGALR